MDFKLDPITHDLAIENFSFTTTVDGVDSLAQRLKIKLQFFKGEWFLDTTFGVPYFQSILTKQSSKDDVDAIFRSQISSTPGIQTLVSYSSVFDRSARTFTIDCTVIDQDGAKQALTLSI